MKFLLLILALTIPSIATAIEISSPDGRVHAEIDVRDGRLAYRVLIESDELLTWSPLGIDCSRGDFRSKVKIVDEHTERVPQRGEPAAADWSEKPRRAVYDLPLGKVAHVDKPMRERLVTIQNEQDAELTLQFVVANDGVAFTYLLCNAQPVRVNSEATGFAFPQGTTSFLHPMAVAKSGWMHTQPSYEEHYLLDRPVGEPSPLGEGWCLPALFKVNDAGWVLLGETGIDANYYGGRLANDSTGGVYRIDLPQAGENLPTDPSEPTVTYSDHSMVQWRFVLVGKTLAPIVESTMATDLIEPLYDLDWEVKPGRAAWSWLSLKDDNITEPVQRQFIDMAAKLKFEYVLIDNWWDEKIGREKIAELVAYARSKNVDVILWYNSNGQWNDAPQTPQDRMHTPEVRAEEMAWIQKVGVKGLKVDFFGGDKQAVMALYDGILRDAAKHGLAINFHGATIPRGWDRMYPNFATCEAVRGMEFCTFEQTNADRQAEHCATLPFTRNVIGPMDFTPIMVSEKLSPYDNAPTRKTALSFELALPVLYHSAIQHFGLVPDDLTTLPGFAVDYLREVPTTWDETRLIDGYPGRFAVIARRKGERWYIGAINGTDAPQTVTIPADLAEKWSVISDDNQGGLAKGTVEAPADGKPLELELPAHAGAVLLSR